MKLRTKITGIAGLILAFSLAITSIIAIADVSKETITLVNERAENNAKYFSSVIDGWMIEKTGIVESTQNYVSTVSPKEDLKIYEYLGAIVKSDPIVSDCYIGIDTGFLYDGSGWVPDESWSCLTRGWYTGALDKNGIYCGDPYVDDNTGDLCISISIPATFKDGTVGVIGMDLNTTALMSGVESLVKSNLSGDAYVVVGATNDAVIYHPNTDFLSTVSEVKEVSKINNGAYKEFNNTTKYFKDYDGKTKFVVSNVIDEIGWTVYLVEPKSVISEVISGVVTKIIIASVIAMIVSAIIMVYILIKFLSPLNTGVEALSTLSDLDMSENEEVSRYLPNTDEVGDIAKAIKVLQSKLNEVVTDVKETSESLEEAVSTVNALSVSSATGAEQISQAVSELASTSQSMAETVQDANSTVLGMGEAIDTIVSSVEKMQKVSTETIKANKEAMEYMEKLHSVSDKSNLAVSDISLKIADCNEAAESIKNATNMITAIASQTNLLSLNASIEAARAGEAGRGFAVVAEEIKGLSEQSDESAREIQQIIIDMVEKVNACVKQSEELKAVITEQMSLLSETESKIVLMNKSSEALTEETDNIGNETNTLVDFKDNVLNNISDLSAISEENAASAEEVSASVTEISDAIKGTEGEAGKMQEFAKVLSEKMNMFH